MDYLALAAHPDHVILSYLRPTRRRARAPASTASSVPFVLHCPPPRLRFVVGREANIGRESSPRTLPHRASSFVIPPCVHWMRHTKENLLLHVPSPSSPWPCPAPPLQLPFRSRNRAQHAGSQHKAGPPASHRRATKRSQPDNEARNARTSVPLARALRPKFHAQAAPSAQHLPGRPASGRQQRGRV